MNPAELKAILGICLAIIGWFIVRDILKSERTAKDLSEFKEAMAKTIYDLTDNFKDELQKIADRNTDALRGLDQAVGALAVAIQEQRADMAERFVLETAHARAVEDLKRMIVDHARRFAHELQAHKDDCTGRKP